MEPAVTIGIPVYNEERFVGEALASAAEQGAVVIVSDNGSSDGTRRECERASRANRLIHYVRHERNLGAAWNFKYCLHNAATPYFMWLGGHDMLPLGYVRTLTAALDRNPRAVLAYGAVQHIDINGQPLRRYEYRFAKLLEDDLALRRVTATISYLADCTLIHGLLRREALEASCLPEPFLGGDHVFLSKAAACGQFAYCPEVAYIRRTVHAEVSDQKQLRRIDPGAVLPQGNPRARMAEEQLALYGDQGLGSWCSRTLWKVNARYQLVRRFSPWPASSAVEALLNEALFLVARVVHRVRQLFQRQVGAADT